MKHALQRHISAFIGSNRSNCYSRGSIEEIEDGQAQAVGLEFDIEVNQGENKDQGDKSSSDGDDDNEEAEKEAKKRKYIGVISKGKYSK